MNLLDECEDLLNGVRLIQELSPKSLGLLVSYGERFAVRLVAAARLNQIGVHAQAFDAWDVGILTDSNFMDARLTLTMHFSGIFGDVRILYTKSHCILYNPFAIICYNNNHVI